jgi:hypothetical protein
MMHPTKNARAGIRRIRYPFPPLRLAAQTGTMAILPINMPIKLKIVIIIAHDFLLSKLIAAINVISGGKIFENRLTKW